MGGSIFVTSFKGGVGKTTVCANLAGALCNLGHTVLVVDGDFGMRCMDIVLGLENEALFDLGDVLAGRTELERAVLQSPRVPSLSFLPAPMNCRVPPDREAVAGVIDALIAAHKAAGQTAPSSHPECRPNPLEAEAVAHLLRITEVAGVPIVIVHLSTKEALLEVMRARARGQQVYVETCPHYLLLDDSVYYQEDYSAAARYICAPPMRKKEDQEVLWKALANGTIQTVSTDHCSFTLQQKDAGRGDFTKIPGGLPGVETRGELLYTAGVAAGRITKEQMCALLSENPARLYGAYPRKGVIAPGSDADLVVYDPAADKTITAGTQLSAAGYTPYEGWRTKGSIAQVYLRGTLAVDHGEMKAGPIGTYIPRHPGAL